MKLEEAVGQVLRKRRTSRIPKLSQEALALEAEVERNYISLLERGKNNATIGILFRLCRVLDVNLSQFISDVEKLLNTPTKPRHRG